MRLALSKRPLLTFALTLTAVSGVAHAQSQQAAKALYDSGKWQEAATAAVALNTSNGFALAAEATTGGAALSADNAKKALFEKAQNYAKQAIKLDPNNAEAYFELARAQGRLAQYSGVFQSLPLGQDMKKNLDQASKLNPKLAGVYVALGLWHANLDVGGLKGVAGRAIGGSKSQITPNFEKAIALEPNVAVHRIEYANALLSQNNKAAAAVQLEKAVTIAADTFWQKRDLDAAKAKLATLK
ncbi:tetratricopeptide repeat protein [Deinococcus sp. QL22]|uniref:tetratricopeptide repeat protein n=1 Tax=Deinococcus sp. QL22 TaxID=2939437 RepID=UPI0020174D79|nr:tetratricopeptide repeat protein [Deinococcus sp. QL22]UQN05795.1 tetratricopeptide repeat protein [Deinococcus sp. QL22]